MVSNFLTSALEALPSIASSPLSFVGYALTIGAWVYTYNYSRKLKILMSKIALIPESDRKSTVVATLGDPLPDSISPEQWILSKRQQYFLVSFIVTLAVFVITIAITIYQGAEFGAAKEAARAKTEICEQQIRDAHNQWNRGKNNMDERIVDLENSIKLQELEKVRGVNGLIYAPPEQKQLAIDIATNAEARIKELTKIKEDVQKQLDAYVATPPALVRCDG